MLRADYSLLSELWPPMRTAVEQLQAYADSSRLSATIVSGLRSMQEQDRLYAKGRTPFEIRNRVAKHGAGGSVTDAPPGESAHNFGLAVDVEGPDQRRVIELARQMGFGLVSWDPAHIEWPNWRRLL